MFLERKEDAVAAILCAGFGTRLRPITDWLPKPALPFLGHPIAAYALHALQGARIGEIAVNTHYLPEIMEKALRESRFYDGGLHFFREEGEILGTGGGLRELARLLPRNRTIVLYHGDVLSSVSIAEALSSHRASGAKLSLVLALREERQTLRGVFCDARNQIVGIRDTFSPISIGPIHELAFTGIHIIEPEILERIPSRGFSCLVNEVYPQMLKEGLRIHPIYTTNYFADLGTHERYLAALRDCMDEPLRIPSPPKAKLDKIQIEKGAKIIEPVHLSGEIRIEQNCQIGPYLSMHGDFSVAHGISLSNAAVFGEGRIEKNLQNELFYSRKT